MPREKITTNGLYHPRVGWHPDQGMQVGIETEGESSLFWMLTGCAQVQDDALGASPDGGQQRALTRVGSYLRAAMTEDRDPGWNVLGLRDDELARLVLNTLDASCNGLVSSVWSDMDRGQVNRLIRLLRRARDAAFGKDE